MDEPPDGVDHAEAINRDSRPVTIDGDTVTLRAPANAATIHDLLPGPWNFVWRANEAVGLIDWDYLHPAPRISDVAYALRWFVPRRCDEFVRKWHHFPEIQTADTASTSSSMLTPTCPPSTSPRR